MPSEWSTNRQNSSALDEFAHGSSTHPPRPDIVNLAGRLSNAVTDNTIGPEITFDLDGALSFDLRLRNNLLMFAELQVDGVLSFTVLDDTGEKPAVVAHFPSATESQFLDNL